MPRKYSTIQIGQKFGRLTVIAFHHTNAAHMRMWDCLCECRNTTIAPSAYLNNGHTRSCGCLQREAAQRMQLSHGQSQSSPEYQAWRSMRSRVRPRAKHAFYYYESGVSVCPEWDDFMVFYAHVGPMPSPNHTVDRWPNPKGNYEPGNVRWATRAEQARNTRQNVWITFQGITLCRTDWALKLGLSDGGLRWRLKHWPIERALTASDAP